jgi:cyclopropane fatty-acyl-phospholipid synthase-like methyltransferase
MLEPGRRGLGFGCGREPLAAVMASRGCEIVATDLDATAAAGLGWIETDQHASALEDLNARGICDPELFRQRVSFRAEDMNRIPPDLLNFDFVWSSCAFEHLGSIRHGLEFVVNAMRCLRPGGVAVHTTEFNLTSNYHTVETHNLVVFRRYDMEQLIRTLEQAGHAVASLNVNPGSGALDRYVDLPPYRNDPQLRLRMDRYVFTSIGLIVERGV